MLKPIVKKTLHKEVMQALTEAIHEGTWQVGEKLPGEIALAATFQVSRACIREVLKALSYSGILESRPGRGTFLKEVPNQSPTIDALGSLLEEEPYPSFMEMRQVLHGQAAYWACERATAEELMNLENIVAGEDQEPLSAHMRFHQEVLLLSHNPILIDILTQLEERFRYLRELNFIILPEQDRVQHIQVFEAIKNGPPSKARSLMMKHVDYIWKKTQ